VAAGIVTVPCSSHRNVRTDQRQKVKWQLRETNRIGDHIWWISDVRKFQAHYPNWKFRYGMRDILEEIHAAVAQDFVIRIENP